MLLDGFESLRNSILQASDSKGSFLCELDVWFNAEEPAEISNETDLICYILKLSRDVSELVCHCDQVR